jgi:hypothetical protein
MSVSVSAALAVAAAISSRKKIRNIGMAPYEKLVI